MCSILRIYLKWGDILRLKSDILLPDFFEMVYKCTGEVFFKTNENDCLNLKSKLSQYLLAASLLNKELAVEGDVVCERAEDVSLLKNFLDEIT